LETRSDHPSLKVITLIHWAITFVPLVFGGFVLYTNLTDPIGELSDSNRIFLYLPGAAMVVAFPASQMVYKNYIKENAMDNTLDLRSKLGIFQAAHLIRISMFEAVALFSAVASFITGTNINLGILCIALAILAFAVPTPFKVAEAMNLSLEERNQLTE
jgi:hypothetical protein